MKKITITTILFVASLLFEANIVIAQTRNADSLLFVSLVTKYTTSIEKADTTLGSKLWAHTGEVSFIRPGGNEHGWNEIKNIYKIFRDNFSDRKLTFSNLRTAVYGDVAWVTFFWVFDAKMNNTSIQTKGRETEIWRKINSEWRLVHIHYSDMPPGG